MSDETIREFIERRDKELRHQIAALEAQLSARNAELDELATIRASIGEAQFKREEKDVFAYAMAPGTTIKEMAIQSLLDRFPKGGTLIDIRDFIQDAYGRDITPSSLRAQMHRLKADGVLGQDPSTDTWNFQDGKRRMYAMYNHPTSRKAMKELKDDPTPYIEIAQPKPNWPNSD